MFRRFSSAFFDLLSTMLEFSGEDATLPTLKVSNDGDAGLFGARVELEDCRLCGSTLAVFDDDRERKSSVDGSTSFSEEFSGSGRVAGHQRLFVLVENQDSVLSRPGFWVL